MPSVVNGEPQTSTGSIQFRSNIYEDGQKGDSFGSQYNKAPCKESSSSSNSYNKENNKQLKAEDANCGKAEALEALRELIIFPLLYSREAQKLGLKRHRALLLCGPQGIGKEKLVRAVVHECGAHLTVISPLSVLRAHAGESERILREAFSEAASHARMGKPSVIYIDEIDALCPHRDSRREKNILVSSQLFALMDSISASSTSSPGVVVVASTSRLEAIDPALRRAGRLDVAVKLTPPTKVERFEILKMRTRKVLMDPNVDLKAIAASCTGYVGDDLALLCREAGMSAYRRSSDVNEDPSVLCLTMEDWEQARTVVGPSITKGDIVEIPEVSWDDIGGLAYIKRKLQQAVEWPVKHSAAFARLGISPIRGILLHGPPGCSKTMLAKATANAAQASLFSLSAADFYSKYVGEGEALLRNTFDKARLAAPSIIFLDEVDVVAAKRGGNSSDNVIGERLLSTLLTEMDGLEQAMGILVLAATNRPHAIDTALMRPGRFDFVLYVPPPDLEARFEILRVHTRKMKMGNDVNLRRIAEDTELFTGAELELLCKEVGMVVLREDLIDPVAYDRHFQIVKNSLKPALTKAEIESYASFMKNSSLRPSTHSKVPTKQEAKGEVESHTSFIRNPSLRSSTLVAAKQVARAKFELSTSFTKIPSLRSCTQSKAAANQESKSSELVFSRFAPLIFVVSILVIMLQELISQIKRQWK